MNQPTASMHGQWSGRLGFILAATGSAVGLGSIWRFPYITGENGGGAFVIVYLLCVALVGVPIMAAEIMLGRRGKMSPINTMAMFVREYRQHPVWRLLGWVGLIAGFMILSYYTVIAGWVMAYTVKMTSGAFVNSTSEFVKTTFDQFLQDPWALLFWHSLFTVITIGVVLKGVEKGLERSVRILMPALLGLMLLVVGYAINMGAFTRGFEFMFTPDFDKLTANAVLIALGHAFFTLSLGMGAIMMYGAYLNRSTSIMSAAITITAADTAVSLLAGLAIFPIVFANNLAPGEGPGLLFVTLPVAFGQMPGGVFFGSLFFLLVMFAAWLSAISLVEPAVAWMVESRGITRPKACAIVGGISWLLGIGTVLSFNVLSDAKFLWGTIFDNLEYLTSNVMLPLGGFFTALLVGWFLPKQFSHDELQLQNPFWYRVWFFVLRYVAPTLVFIVFLSAIGLFK